MGHAADEDIVIPGKKKRRARPEAILQVACVEFLRVLERTQGLRFVATMPEGERSPARAGWAKAMGMRAGVPDLIIFQARGGHRRTIFVELKAPKGSLSEAQIDFQKWAESAGYGFHVVKDVLQLQAILA